MKNLHGLPVVSSTSLIPACGKSRSLPVFRAVALASSIGLLAIGGNRLEASQAYGSINNFDAVNDTGSECHGFEIELDDIHSTDITYTFDWNHYGTPQISEDNTDPLHPKVLVEYQSGKTPTGDWAAFTAIPAAPIAPTQGHQFTDPSVNFGGEHFGVGYSGVPSNIKYHWLMDDGSGNLVQGPAVSVGTPVFSYIPPVAAVPAKIQAVIVPPEVEPTVLEFGHASWVKEIRTSTHNNRDVKLRELMTKDEVYPKNAASWENQEPAEVEMEWQLLQTEFAAVGGGKNGELQGAPEPLEKGDEVITRRYEFYAYVGPIDPETGEALADVVAKDGIHGTNTYSTTVIVGKFLGSQMSAARAVATVGLVDHVQDGEVGVPFPARKLVIAGAAPFTASRTGTIPAGMTFDKITGILSGTPNTAGKYSFKIRANDGILPVAERNYIITVATPGAVVPPHSAIATAASPPDAGSVAGDGDVVNGTKKTVTCTPNPGFVFLNWTEAGAPRSVFKTYTFKVDTNHALVANFTPEGVKVAQTITFPGIPAQKFRHAPITLRAKASSGLPVQYSIDSGPATVAGNLLTMTGPGTVVVRVKQPGNHGFAAARGFTRTFVVSN